MTSLDRLLTAIRKGRVVTCADAAAAVGVTEQSIWRLLRAARSSGYCIETDPTRNATQRRPWRIRRNGK
jgi:predicted DNA-binding transcriptional regulator YafY